MSFITEKNIGDYNITKYTSGGTIRRRLDDKIVASYTNFWTKDDSIHPETLKQINHIEEKLGIKIYIR
jgi:hypothetical protein